MPTTPHRLCEEQDPVNRRWRSVTAQRDNLPEHIRDELVLVTTSVLVTFVLVGILLQLS